MSSANAPNPVVVPVPNFVQHLHTLRGVFPAPGETVLRPDLLDALTELNGALAPPQSPGERRLFQCFVWQQNVRNGLTLLLLNATRNIVELDQQREVLATLVACIRSIFVTGFESCHLSGKLLLDCADIANIAVDAIPLAIDKCWSNFRDDVIREPPSTEVMQMLEGLVELGYLVHQLSESSPSLSSHALDQRMRESRNLAELMLNFIIYQDDMASITRTVTHFSRIFDGYLPPNMELPGQLDKLGVVFASILKGTHTGGLCDDADYKSTVNAIFSVLSHPQFRSSVKKIDRRQCTARTQRELCQSLCTGYWKLQRSYFKGGLSKREVLTLTMRTFISVCYIAGCSLRAMKFSDGVFQSHFMPLVARGLLAWQLQGDKAIGPGNSNETIALCTSLGEHLLRVGSGFQSNRKFLGNILKQSGPVDLLDALESAKIINTTSPTSSPIRLWEEFCRFGKLELRNYRSREAKQRANKVDTWTGGCTWENCPMYRTKGLERRELQYCRQCRAAVYCGKFYQERDRNGQHQERCVAADI